MEVGMAWLSSPTSFPSRTHLKNCLPSSVLMFQAQAIHLVHCNATRDEYKPPLNTFKEDGPSQEASDRKQMEMETSFYKEKSDESDQFTQKFERQMFDKPEFWNIVESRSSSMSDLDKENNIVRSIRHLERISIRRVSKTKGIAPKPHNSKKIYRRRNKSKDYGSNSNDAEQFFLWGQDTKLLTPDEESELVLHMQRLRNLERVKRKLQSSLGREPTMAEWAQGAWLSRKELRARICSGVRSRQKLFSANLRMVVHVAKKYQDHGGLSLQDLIQAGRVGLLKSFEKFRRRGGCRFGTYAYFWIRHSVQRAVSSHSRIIRLPNVFYHQLRKIKGAKSACLREGNYNPTLEELARRTGLSVDKVEMVLFESRPPMSLQGLAWDPDDGCYFVIEESIVDPEHENPEVSLEKEMMKQHIRGILNTLKPRERQVMVLRYGIEDGQPKSLSAIGVMFGLSKQSISQVEIRAMVKLKECIDDHELEAYAHLLV
nr:plastidic RNA polymerase sigma-subunit 6 [Passiflora tenuiloba]